MSPWRFGLWIVGWLVGAGGCSAPLNSQQRAWLAEGQDAYTAGRYADAIEPLSLLLAEAEPVGSAYAQALYLRGMSYAQSGQRGRAFSDLRECVTTAADRDVVWRAYVVLGTMSFEDGNWADAMVAYRAAADRMPARPPQDLVLFRLGLCYERLGKWDNARGAYARLAQAFADEPLGQEARRKLNRNAGHFAIQAGVFNVADNAKAQLERLRRHNLPAYLRREIHHRVPRNVVLVGRYATYEDARRQLALVRQHVPDAVLWP